MNDKKRDFYKIMRCFDSKNQQEEFLLWVEENWNIQDIKRAKEEENRQLLINIASEIRRKVPLSGVLSNEKIMIKDDKNEREEHVDEFLYDDNFLEENMPKYYCLNCGGRDIKIINFITHSFSIDRLQYIFDKLLPYYEGETIVDVGSRTGAVLYASYVYTNAKRILGIEMSKDWCKIQQEIINKYELSDRIEIVCADVRHSSNEISSADLIVLNNVFEYFMSSDLQRDCWNFMATHLQADTYIVLVPKAADIFSKCKVDFDWTLWLKDLEINNSDELHSDIGFYQVIRRLDNMKT